jgi:hypothetical protein
VIGSAVLTRRARRDDDGGHGGCWSMSMAAVRPLQSRCAHKQYDDSDLLDERESMRICLLVIGADRCPVYPARFAWRRLPYLSFMLTGANASANYIQGSMHNVGTVTHRATRLQSHMRQRPIKSRPGQAYHWSTRTPRTAAPCADPWLS